MSYIIDNTSTHRKYVASDETGGVNKGYRSPVVWLWFLLFSIVVQLLANYDSPLHYYFQKVDSSWFFMGGKAMMNGYIPYVDFSDSKGPLVWLFYGLGYLISPTSFHGVYVLHCLLFSFVFLLAFRLSCLVFDHKPVKARMTLSVVSVLIFAIPLFTYNHREMRCEDLCQLPLLYCIYCMTYYIKKGVLLSRQAYLIGLSMACILMIKWNFAIYSAIIPLSIIIIVIKRRYHAASLTGWMTAGFLTIVAPILLIFGIMGILPVFVNEYFFNTASTFSRSFHDILIRYFLIDMPSSFSYTRIIGFMACFVPIYYFKSYGKPKYVPTLCALFMFFTFSYWGGAAVHYHSSYVSWFVFLSCMIAQVICVICRYSRIVAFTVAVVASFSLIGLYVSAYHHNWIWSDTNKVFEDSERRLSRLHSPKILNLGAMEYSIGLSANALPACRYWSLQSNAGFQYPQQVKALNSRIPDIVVVPGDADLVTPEMDEVLDSLRYSHLSTVPNIFRSYYHVYVKDELYDSCME